jgi:hyperosmotically inducible protein
LDAGQGQSKFASVFISAGGTRCARLSNQVLTGRRPDSSHAIIKELNFGFNISNPANLAKLGGQYRKSHGMGPMDRTFRAGWLAVIGAAILMLATAPVQAIELINPFSIIKSAVEAAVEDRSSEDIAKDLAIKATFTKDVISEMGADVISIKADVYEQDVMLTGVVEDPKQKAQAEKLTRKIEDMKKIYNEVRVIKPVKKEKGVVENFVDDTVIESKINALLLDGKGVNVTNFRWRSVGGHVYLFGRALGRAEKAKATKIVKEIKNVQSVKNLAKIKPKKK